MCKCPHGHNQASPKVWAFLKSHSKVMQDSRCLLYSGSSSLWWWSMKLVIWGYWNITSFLVTVSRKSIRVQYFVEELYEMHWGFDACLWHQEQTSSFSQRTLTVTSHSLYCDVTRYRSRETRHRQPEPRTGKEQRETPIVISYLEFYLHWPRQPGWS